MAPGISKIYWLVTSAVAFASFGFCFHISMRPDNLVHRVADSVSCESNLKQIYVASRHLPLKSRQSLRALREQLAISFLVTESEMRYLNPTEKNIPMAYVGNSIEVLVCPKDPEYGSKIGGAVADTLDFRPSYVIDKSKRTLLYCPYHKIALLPDGKIVESPTLTIPNPVNEDNHQSRLSELAPDFQLSDTEGETWHLQSLRGENVLLCFFCGCTPCHQLAIQLQDENLQRKNTRILVVASMDAEGIASFQKETGLSAIYLIDSFGDVSKRYESLKCPRLWLIDRVGVLRCGSRLSDETADIIRKITTLLKSEGEQNER